jgi:integrase
MPELGRTDLEEAARQFFKELVAENDGRRNVDPDDPDRELDYVVAIAGERIGELEIQLRTNQFDRKVRHAAEEIAALTDTPFSDLTPERQLTAEQLAARAEREHWRHVGHVLREPWKPFAPEDVLFELDGDPEIVRQTPSRRASARFSISVGDAADQFLRRKSLQGVGRSHLDELARALTWLKEFLGANTDLAAVDKAQVRAFRDGLERLGRHQGRSGISFRERQTADRGRWISSVTSSRYWQTVRAMFEWCAAEGLVTVDPAMGLRINRRRDDQNRTPAPFSTAELQRLFKSPLFAGHRSSKQLLVPGDRVERGSLFWAGVVALYTGMRAAEINQLNFGDFDFDAIIPVIKIRPEDDAGQRTKRTKTASSVREVPIADVLLKLGLREFVEGRRRRRKTGRVLHDVGLGVGDRRSDGLTKGWRRVLVNAGVHQPGRSMHVLRHTFTAALRSARAREEIISALLGHTLPSVTAHYGGGKFPLDEMAEAVNSISYGLDVVAQLGGPYEAKRHRA